jgi:hypothetical protein
VRQTVSAAKPNAERIAQTTSLSEPLGASLDVVRCDQGGRREVRATPGPSLGLTHRIPPLKTELKGKGPPKWASATERV